MSDRDSSADTGDLRRPAPGRRRGPQSESSAGDGSLAAEGGGGQGSTDAAESSYSPAATGGLEARPLKVRIELVVVDGPAAKALLRNQAAAVKRALQWFADHPATDERHSE